MKKLLYIFLSISLSLSIYSCDLDTMPTDAVDTNLAFTSADNADKVLNGTWRYMMDTYFTYANPGWCSIFRNSDAMGNDVAVQPGKYGYLSAYNFNSMNQITATAVRAPWQIGYKVIDNCNHIINKIDGTPGGDDLKKRIKAQALALRGYVYLNLATFYQFTYRKDPSALCVPIYTEYTTETSKPKGKSTVQEVYSRATSDLTDAYKLLEGLPKYTRDEKYQINKSVIAGILARAYLQMGLWDDAEGYADEAQASAAWMSQDSYLEGFNDLGNVEWIWGHGQQPDQSDASYHFNFIDVSSSASYYYSFMADPYFKDFFDTNDVRSQLFQWDTTRYIGGLMYKKFRFRSNLTGDLVLMRKAEMVLIQAECLAEQDDLPGAIGKLNSLRIARGADTPNLSSLSKEDLIEEILIERRKELFGEGFSLSDILRRQKAVERKGVASKTPVIIDGKVVVLGKEKKDTAFVKGHTTLRFPNKTNFIPNSDYYLFVVPSNESTNNPNI